MKLYCYTCKEQKETSTWFSSIDGKSRQHECSSCKGMIIEPILTTKLIDMPFDEARKAKFQIGRAEHGPVFKRNPVEEIDMELIDAVNYAEEAIRQGFDAAKMAAIIEELERIDELVRGVYIEGTP